MSIDTANLRALALAATQQWSSGVWIEIDGNEWRATGPGHESEAHDAGSEPGCPDEQAAQADAAFIAAASPSAVLALLDENAKLATELDESGSDAIRCHGEYKQRRNEQFAAYDLAHRATIAFLLDRAEQYDASSGYRAFVDELVGSISRREHVESAKAGEYGDLKARVDHLVTHWPKDDGECRHCAAKEPT